MENREISQELSKKYGAEILRAGIDAAERRQQEFAFNHPSARGAQLVLNSPTSTPPETRTVTPRRPSSRPETVNIWPEIATSAWQNNKDGAFRLWVLGKTIDIRGSGVVTDEELRDKANKLKIHSRRYRRWRAAAIELGLFEVLQRRSGIAYRMVSWGIGGKHLGCSYVGGRYVTVPLSKLFKKGWRATIWSAIHTRRSSPKKYAYHDKKDDKAKEKIITVFSPISREKLQDLYGVPPTTQRRLEKQAGIKVWFNYANTGIKPDDPDLMREMSERKPVFIYKRKFKNRAGKSKQIEHIGWQMPNTYKVPKRAAQAGLRGRSKKINTALSVGSSIPERVPESERRRLYYSDRKAAADAQKQHVDDGIAGETYALMPRWIPARKSNKRQRSYVYEVLPHGI